MTRIASSRRVVATWLRGLPKAELHLHLEGTVSPETLVELSQRHDDGRLTLAEARALYRYKDFNGFLLAFKAVSERLRTAAHALKGSVANFVSKRAVDAAYQLEVMGREQNLTDAEIGYARLDEEIARLSQFLSGIAKGKPVAKTGPKARSEG